MIKMSYIINDKTISEGNLSPYTKYELYIAQQTMSPEQLQAMRDKKYSREREIVFSLPTMKKLHDNMVLSAATYLENKMVIDESTVPCKKCGDKKVMLSSRQTRSADEATTTFFACFGCGHKWREG